MQYRRFGSIDFSPSALGFGCMRLPTLGEPSQIDEPAAIEMIHHAVDNGVNYVDTAYGYHGGNSERLVAKALKGGYRERVKLATKLPVDRVTTPADFDRLLNEQLGKLEVDHIDFYLFHGLKASRWRLLQEFDGLKWAEGAIRDGRISHIGFSFHDTLSVFKRIVDGYDNWAMCQVQYNFLDDEFQAGTEGVRYAATKGLAVVVMEPLLGGRLASPPDNVKQIFDGASAKRSPVDWALQWVWNQPEISLALSGMGAMEQVVQNLESAERSGTGLLTPDEMAVIAAARDAYRADFPIPCTQCRYCMPCPSGVDIPLNLQLLNRAVGHDGFDRPRFRYKNWDRGVLASACAQCQTCEDKCPQSIPISEWMPYIDQVFGQGATYDPTVAPLARRA